jgi:gliding motility-associated-like protein
MLLIGGSGYGQTSAQGRFTVDFVEGCNTLDVIIIPEPTLFPCPCNVYFDGGSGNPVDDNISLGELTKTVTYTAPGTYNLIVVHEGLDRDSIQVVVHENLMPTFTSSACSNRQVDVDITDTNYDAYHIDYGDGGTAGPITQGSHPPTYTYATAGSYNILVRGVNTNAKDNCDNGTSNVQVVDVLPDATITDLLLSATNEAVIGFTADNSVQYFLEIQVNGDNVNGFQRYLSDPLTTSPLTIDDSNLNFDTNFYCFRIATFDPCNNSVESYSNTFCSVDLEDITVNNLENGLAFRTVGDGLIEHEINRDGTDLFSLTSSTTHNDNLGVICNTAYCYKIISTYLYNGITLTSTSLTRCATARSLNTPSRISEISIDATLSPVITWSAPIDFVTDAYEISSPEVVLGTSTSTTYSDGTTDPSLAAACYTIGYVDECGNTAELSKSICSIFLSQQTTNDVTTLKWTKFNGWSAGVLEYQLLRNGVVIDASTNSSFELPSTQDTQNTTYQITAIPNDISLPNSLSNEIHITNRTNITFPNAFVVNGLNDEFKVVGRYIINFDLKIYSRWGELIAHITNQADGWDGTSNGRLAPQGNYIYAAEIEDEAGNIHVKNGTVLLIRK